MLERAIEVTRHAGQPAEGAVDRPQRGGAGGDHPAPGVWLEPRVDRRGAGLVAEVGNGLGDQREHHDVGVVERKAVEARAGQALELGSRLLVAAGLREQHDERAAQRNHARVRVGQGP